MRKLSWVDDLSTRKRRSISLSARATPVLRHSLTSFLFIAEQEGFSNFWVERSFTQVQFAHWGKWKYFMCIMLYHITYKINANVNPWSKNTWRININCNRYLWFKIRFEIPCRSFVESKSAFTCLSRSLKRQNFGKHFMYIILYHIF